MATIASAVVGIILFGRLWRSKASRQSAAADVHRSARGRAAASGQQHMPFPVESRYIAAAETRLQTAFPSAYRSWLMSSNGGIVEIAGEPWFLHPVLDDSDVTRLRRTWDDVVRQTWLARALCAFPATGVAIAENGGGDRLVLLPARGPDAAQSLGRLGSRDRDDRAARRAG
ncbi:MAG TPA: SMI1/KNR4 family protein [Planctomycetota bacterium]